jgi:hypothetical protein
MARKFFILDFDNNRLVELKIKNIKDNDLEDVFLEVGLNPDTIKFIETTKVNKITISL